MNKSVHVKPLDFVGSSREDLTDFPEEVKEDIGYALFEAQRGGKAGCAKPLKGFGSAGVLEILEDHRGETYRAVYTVRFYTAVYVLHCFQKKSKHGIDTPKPDMELIRRRLKAAEEDHKVRSLRGDKS
jgi:phage-related protein